MFFYTSSFRINVFPLVVITTFRPLISTGFFSYLKIREGTEKLSSQPRRNKVIFGYIDGFWDVDLTVKFSSSPRI